MSQQNTTNLFSALGKYSLKPKITPLENFCTELLAWCLQNSNSFQKEFLKLIDLDFLKNSEELEIRTQQYWTASEKDDEEDEKNNRSGLSGFFDFEIQSPPKASGKRDFLAVIESKIGAPFRRDQLENYRAELKKKTAEYQECYLITLTNHSQKPSAAYAHIKWSQVHELLSKIVVEEKLTIIYRQFADFLKEKGMAHMKIDKIKTDSNWSDCLSLQTDLWGILNGLRETDELKPLLKNRIAFEPSKNEPKLWLGIYGRTDVLYWCGFEFSDIKNPSKLCMMVQKTMPGNYQVINQSLDETLKGAVGKPEFSSRENMTWLSFYRPIGVDSEFNGNAEKIRDWLFAASKEISKLGLK
jgi:PD-(D/E)XK nuclease superfamily protein